MSRVTFIQQNGGASATIEVAIGQSLMQAAVNEMIPNILGECGGALACGTCHIKVDERWLPHLPAMDEMERDMIDATDDTDHRSRLACQIDMQAALDGIVVHVPA